MVWSLASRSLLRCSSIQRALSSTAPGFTSGRLREARSHGSQLSVCDPKNTCEETRFEERRGALVQRC